MRERLCRFKSVRTCRLLCLFALACLAGSLRLLLTPGILVETISLAPDSEGYQLLAANLIKMNVYDQRLLVEKDQYDAVTRSVLTTDTVETGGDLRIGRSPGYPLFLAAVYQLHGYDSKWILRYQQVMTFLSAALLPLIGYRASRFPGALAGLLAVGGLICLYDSGYSCVQLLTECLAEFLLVIAIFCISSIRSTHAIWPLAGGFVLGCAVLTRPGMICILPMLGLLGLFSFRKAAFLCAFGVGIVLLPWLIGGVAMTGKWVGISGNTSSVVVAGISPDLAAGIADLQRPELTAESLESFWCSWPGCESPGLTALMIEIRNNPSYFLSVQAMKLKIAIACIPFCVWMSAFYWIALVGAKLAVRSKQSSFSKLPEFFLTLLFACGLLMPSKWILIGMMAIISLLLVPICKAENTSVDRGSLMPWVAIMCCISGYFMMVLASFAHQRFVRPFEPIICLAAALGAVAVGKALYASMSFSASDSSNSAGE